MTRNHAELRRWRYDQAKEKENKSLFYEQKQHNRITMVCQRRWAASFDWVFSFDAVARWSTWFRNWRNRIPGPTTGAIVSRTNNKRFKLFFPLIRFQLIGFCGNEGCFNPLEHLRSCCCFWTGLFLVCSAFSCFVFCFFLLCCFFPGLFFHSLLRICFFSRLCYVFLLFFSAFLRQFGECSTRVLSSTPRSLSLSDLFMFSCSRIGGGFGKLQKDNLISDVMFGAKILDPSLKNPWAIVMNNDTNIWVAVNGMGLLNIYSLQGTLLRSVVVTAVDNGTADPTGLVKYSGSGFLIGAGNNTLPSKWITVTESGTINAWNPVIDPLNAHIVFSDPDKVFKGCDILHDMLYVTDFSGGMVDVWNSSWAMVNSFTDPSLTAIGYAPYGIQAVGDWLYVTFAKQDAAKHDGVTAMGMSVSYLFSHLFSISLILFRCWLCWYFLS